MNCGSKWFFVIFASKALAEKIGLQEPNLSRILNGKAEPHIDTLEKIASGLGIELWELFIDPDEPISTH